MSAENYRVTTETATPEFRFMMSSGKEELEEGPIDGLNVCKHEKPNDQCRRGSSTGRRRHRSR
jgi:hypothetical protein